MAQLRHIAIAVPTAEVEKTARYYEEVFGMKRFRQSELAVELTDGCVNFAIVDNEKEPTARGYQGIYHIGFVVDDVGDTRRQIEAHHGTYVDDDERLRPRGISEAGKDQRKLRGPDGTNLDIANAEFARARWGIPI